MKKMGNSRLFAFAAVSIVVSLLWFFWVKDIVIGIIWVCIGIGFFVVAVDRYVRERKKK